MGHVILKQVIDIVTDGSGDVFLLQQRLSDLYSAEILPTLSTSFDTCSNDEIVSCFDQIVVDLGYLTEDDLYRDETIRGILNSISTQILEQLRINAARTIPGTTSYPVATHAFDHWMFYMKNGYLRWNVVDGIDRWENAVLESAATDQKSVDALRRLILSDEHALSRIVLQHGEDFKSHIIEALTAENQTSLTEYIQQLQSILNILSQKHGTQIILSDHRMSLWKFLFRMIAADPQQRWTTHFIILRLFSAVVPSSLFIRLPLLPVAKSSSGHLPLLELLVEHFGESISGAQKSTLSSTDPEVIAGADLERIASENVDSKNDELPSILNISLTTPLTPADFASGVDQKLAANIPSDPAGLFVKHAGLVVLHPFINTFFGFTSVIADNKFIDSFHRNKAMLLLQYIAQGDASYAEHEMVMAKILCGVPLAQAIDISVPLTQEDKKSADELLREVIGHWSILKNTTPDGLREGFLQRPGKYYETNTNHFLHVENSSIDILLDHLPWGLSMLKFPWMKFMLNIEWR
jgi:hypothetical protein